MLYRRGRRIRKVAHEKSKRATKRKKREKSKWFYLCMSLQSSSIVSVNFSTIHFVLVVFSLSFISSSISLFLHSQARICIKKEGKRWHLYV